MAITLTQTERQILANQYKILSHLDKENQDEYELKIEILYKGFERNYDSVINVYDEHEVTTKEVCKETVEILQMYRRINNAVARLSPEEKEKLDLNKIKFEGFDANNDAHYFYAQFMIERQGKWKEQKEIYLNSHSSLTLDKYRRMLKVMVEKQMNSKVDLDKDDLINIIDGI